MAIADAVRRAGNGATELPAWGHSGPVALIGIVMPRRELVGLTDLVNGIDASSFITVDDNHQVLRGYHLAK